MSRSNGGTLAGLVLVVALLGAGWYFREPLLALVGRGNDPVEVSPEAADAAEEKLLRLRSGGEVARLSSVEASSLLRFRTPPWLSGRVHEPGVEFASDTVRLSGTIATGDLPSHPELDRVRVLLPDSSRVEVSGVIAPLASGRIAMDVDRVTFAGIPIPNRYYPDVLARFGRVDEPGLGPSSLAVPLPDGVGAARVENGSLVLSPR